MVKKTGIKAKQAKVKPPPAPKGTKKQPKTIKKVLERLFKPRPGQELEETGPIASSSRTRLDDDNIAPNPPQTSLYSGSGNDGQADVAERFDVGFGGATAGNDTVNGTLEYGYSTSSNPGFYDTDYDSLDEDDVHGPGNAGSNNGYDASWSPADETIQGYGPLSFDGPAAYHDPADNFSQLELEALLNQESSEIPAPVPTPGASPSSNRPALRISTTDAGVARSGSVYTDASTPPSALLSAVEETDASTTNTTPGNTPSPLSPIYEETELVQDKESVAPEGAQEEDSVSQPTDAPEDGVAPADVAPASKEAVESEDEEKEEKEEEKEKSDAKGKARATEVDEPAAEEAVEVSEAPVTETNGDEEKTQEDDATEVAEPASTESDAPDASASASATAPASKKDKGKARAKDDDEDSSKDTTDQESDTGTTTSDPVVDSPATVTPAPPAGPSVAGPSTVTPVAAEQPAPRGQKRRATDVAEQTEAPKKAKAARKPAGPKKPRKQTTTQQAAPVYSYPTAGSSAWPAQGQAVAGPSYAHPQHTPYGAHGQGYPAFSGQLAAPVPHPPTQAAHHYPPQGPNQVPYGAPSQGHYPLYHQQQQAYPATPSNPGYVPQALNAAPYNALAQGHLPPPPPQVQAAGPNDWTVLRLAAAQGSNPANPHHTPYQSHHHTSHPQTWPPAPAGPSMQPALHYPAPYPAQHQGYHHQYPQQHQQFQAPAPMLAQPAYVQQPTVPAPTVHAPSTNATASVSGGQAQSSTGTSQPAAYSNFQWHVTLQSQSNAGASTVPAPTVHAPSTNATASGSGGQAQSSTGTSQPAAYSNFQWHVTLQNHSNAGASTSAAPPPPAPSAQAAPEFNPLGTVVALSDYSHQVLMDRAKPSKYTGQ